MAIKVILITVLIMMFSAICIENIELREQLRISNSIIWCYEHPIVPKKYKRPIMRKIK